MFLGSDGEEYSSDSLYELISYICEWRIAYYLLDFVIAALATLTENGTAAVF